MAVLNFRDFPDDLALAVKHAALDARMSVKDFMVECAQMRLNFKPENPKAIPASPSRFPQKSKSDDSAKKQTAVEAVAAIGEHVRPAAEIVPPAGSSATLDHCKECGAIGRVHMKGCKKG